jgi:hypothetical protein
MVRSDVTNQDLGHGLGIREPHRKSFNPLGKVVREDQDVTMAATSDRQWTDNVHTNDLPRVTRDDRHQETSRSARWVLLHAALCRDNI